MVAHGNYDKSLGTTVLKDVAVDQAIEVSEATGKLRTLWRAPHGGGAKAAKSPAPGVGRVDAPR